MWLALVREENVRAAWEDEVCRAFADPDEGGMEPIRLGWREARADPAAARATLTEEHPCEGVLLRLVLRSQAEFPSDALPEPAWAVLRGATCRLRKG